MGKRLISLLLAAAMLVCMLPAAAFAEGEEPVPEPKYENGMKVIKSVSATGYDAEINGFNITLTVPYAKKNTTFTLANVLKFTENEGYADVNYDYSEASLEATYPDSVSTKLTVSYKDPGNLEAELFTSTYNVYLECDKPVDPTFKDEITVFAVNGTNYNISASQLSEYYKKNDGKEFGYITISGENDTIASILVNGEKYTEAVAVGTLSSVSIVPVAEGEFAFDISAQDIDKNAIEGVVKVNVKVVKSTSIDDILLEGITSWEWASIPGDVMNKKYNEITNVDIDFVKFTLPSTGTLYKGYISSAQPGTAIKSTTTIKKAELDEVVFVPSKSSDGTCVVEYTASCKDSTIPFTGKVNIPVTKVNVNLSKISKSISTGTVAELYKSDFASSLSSVEFLLPSAEYGNLKNGTSAYTKQDAVELTADTKITFTPKSGFTGTAVLYYIGKNAEGAKSYGTVEITVKPTTVDTITYDKFTVDDIKKLDKTDINKVFKAATGSSNDFYSIKINSLPSSTYGVLYVNYDADASKNTKAVKDTAYYYSGTSKTLVSDITFVPLKAGTTSFDYTVYSTSSDTKGLSGTITFKISESEYDLGDVKYTGEFGKAITFKAADFQKVLTNAETTSSRRTLDYIEFDALPSSKYGVLYYNYDASKTTNSKVKTTTKLYYNDDDEIEIGDVTFVPANAYSGTFNIEYTAYNTKGNEYEGRIVVTVKDGGTELENITYTLESGKVFTFVPSDINTKFDKLTGENFDYIKFTLPSSSAGTLYYDYLSATNKGTAVRKSDSLYRTKVTGKDYDLLKNVSFVPVSGFNGTVTISYTAYSSEIEDKTFTGKIVLTYKAAQSFSDVKSTDYFYKPVLWAVEQGITEGTSATKFSPNNNCTRAQAVTFLWRAAGEPEPKSKTTAFTDVKSGDYYYKAVLWAVEQGITDGTSKTKFSPNAYCTRAQIVTFMWRFAGKPASSRSMTFSDVTATSYYVTAVKWALQKGITDGLSTTKFGPNNNCTRGQIVTFLYRYYN